MSYLGIDVERSKSLAATLLATGSRIAPIVRLVSNAETLSGLQVDVVPRLDEVDADMETLASSVLAAAATAISFRAQIQTMPRLVPSIDPRWDATPAAKWNDVHQEASHNSFAVDGGIASLYERGVRTFELDIHRGEPTDLVAPLPWPLGPLITFYDHNTHTGGRPDDWLVYHHSVDTESEYEYFTDGLRAIAELDSGDPITVFVDSKDGFGGSHSAAQFDGLLASELKGRIYTPADLMERRPGATTLAEAIDQAGWPTVQELHGRVMVVVTDDVYGYNAEVGLAFVAPKPEFSVDATGQLEHIGDPNVVIYNQDEAKLARSELELLQATGNLVRTYFGGRCDDALDGAKPNFRAVHHESPEIGCEIDEPKPAAWPWAIPRPRRWPF